MSTRKEKDTLGFVEVPADKYWGAQTQRSTKNFRINQENGKMPLEIIKAFAVLKKAAAKTNHSLGVLTEEKSVLIGQVCDEILAGKLDDQFPLVVWQTGSGTQSNMNCNEVIAFRGHVLNGGKLTDENKVLHPNDDVNKSQSSNDTFPTAMHIAAYAILMEVTMLWLTARNIRLIKSWLISLHLILHYLLIHMSKFFYEYHFLLILYLYQNVH